MYTTMWDSEVAIDEGWTDTRVEQSVQITADDRAVRIKLRTATYEEYSEATPKKRKATLIIHTQADADTLIEMIKTARGSLRR